MFIRDDLPTFERPMKANSGNFCFGFSEMRVLLPAKSASVIFIRSCNAQTERKDIKFIFISIEIVVHLKENLLNL